jgi:uncharacterized protein YkwD
VAATPTPSPTPIASVPVSGSVVDLPYDGTSAHPGYSVLPSGAAAAPGAPIAGAAVYVGPTVLGGAVAPSTVPTGFQLATTSASGAFSLPTVPIGHLAITIFAPAPHVTVVHQDLIVAAPSTAAGTYFMTVPSASENGWFAQENADRATFSVASTVLDESVVEAGRYWAQFMQANDYFAHCIPASLCVTGDTTPPPASYGPQDVDPQHRFESTGHFLNIVDANYVWTGFGIAALAGSGPFYDQEFSLLDSTAPSATSAARRRGMPLAR